MRTFGVGHDHGNSCTTVSVYVNGQERLLTFPSVSADGSLDDLANGRKGEGNEAITVNHQALRAGEYVLQYNGSERFVGDLALTEGKDVSTGRKDIHRYWKRRSLETLLTATATLIPDTDYEVLVVTGLPIATFNDENRRKVKVALNGMHRFTLNGRERRAYIKVGKVLMEGAGAAILHGIEENDDILGFIDIGGYSTDLYVRQGLQAITKLSAGKDIGVEQVTDMLNQWFKAKYQYDLSMKDRTQILRAYASSQVAYPKISANGVRVGEQEFEQWTGKAIADVGARISEFVSQVWHVGQTGHVAANFARVEIIGGGAYYFADEITRLIPFASVADAPELSNAQGYGWFAEQLVEERARAAS